MVTTTDTLEDMVCDLVFVNEAVQRHVSDTGLRQDIAGRIDKAVKFMTRVQELSAERDAKTRRGRPRGSGKTRGGNKKSK